MNFWDELMSHGTVWMVGQFIGLIPMVLAFFVYAFNDRKKILITKLFSDVLWVVHYIMLGAYAGAAVNVIGVVRDYTFSKKTPAWNKRLYIPAIFILLSAVSTLLTTTGWIVLLPIVGQTMNITGFWCSEPKIMRRFMLPGLTCWLVYGVLVLSFPTIGCNVFSIISLCIGEYNYRKALRKGSAE